MTGVSRFDCFPSDFLNGMIGMTADQIAVYWVVILLQYDRGESVVYAGRERSISIRAGMSQGRLVKAIDGLIAMDKLQLENGRLSNRRTSQELEKIRERIDKNRANSSRGGESTRSKFSSKSKENNDDVRPIARPIARPKQGPIPSSPVPQPPAPVPQPPAPIEDSGTSPESISAKALHAFAGRFYQAYPKHVDPREAEKAFGKAVAKGADPEWIISRAGVFAEAHRSAGTEKQFIPAPSVWLNRGGYDSEDLPQARASPARSEKNGFLTLLAETYRGENVERSQKEINPENVRVVSTELDDNVRSSRGDDGGLSGNAATVLIGNSVRRM